MLIFYLLSIINAQTCKKQDLLTTCYMDSYQSYMATYQKIASDTMYLFIGSKPGQTAFYFDYLGVGPNSTYQNWTDLGHLMFLDIQGAGYTTQQRTPKTIQEYSQLYVIAYNLFKSQLDFQYTRLYIVTSGISSKIALEIGLQLKAYSTILFSPLLDLWENMKNLPSSAYNMGLIEMWERQELELSLFHKQQAHYSDYQQLVNNISKLSGDMLISDFRKFEQDTSTIILTDYMNNQEIKNFYNAENQFFKTFNVNSFNNMIDALSFKTDLSKYLSDMKIICFIPQFSIATNIPGTINYFVQYQEFKNKPFKYHFNQDDFTIYTQLESLYIIQNSGDKIYQDQSQIVKDILKELKMIQ